MSNTQAVRDSSWYGGTPLWVLAEQHLLLSASFYWVGSEAAMKGIYPSYYYSYNEKINIDEFKKINFGRYELINEFTAEKSRCHAIRK